MNQEFYINLIVKQLSEEITDSEKSVLDTWLAEDSKHQTILNEVTRVWNQSDEYKSDYQPNIAQAWTNINQATKTTSKVVPLKRNYRWASIAAAIIILLGIGWMIHSSINSTTTIYSGNQEQLEIILPDGSLVSLNENSSISYHKKFKSRNVDLKGEAFFDVQHNAKRPFTVHANSTETTVLGTTFNVSAYADGNQDKVGVALFTGKIAFSANNINPIIINPGESVSYDLSTKSIDKKPTTNKNITAWKTRQLIFDQTDISEVVHTLNDFYHQDIQLHLPNGNTCVFTGKFENATLEKVIDVLSFTYDLDYLNNEDQHSINIKNCN